MLTLGVPAGLEPAFSEVRASLFEERRAYFVTLMSCPLNEGTVCTFADAQLSGQLHIVGAVRKFLAYSFFVLTRQKQ